MRLLNVIQPGDWVYPITYRTARYYVVGVSGDKLKLRGYEIHGYYFNATSFRKVRP